MTTLAGRTEANEVTRRRRHVSHTRAVESLGRILASHPQYRERLASGIVPDLDDDNVIVEDFLRQTKEDEAAAQEKFRDAFARFRTAIVRLESAIQDIFEKT